MWYDRLRSLRDEGEVEIVGLIQEQHPDRCRLFLQWKEMDFPILVDAANRIGVSAVPLLWAIDEHGVVRRARPDIEWFEGEFLDTEYPAPADDEANEGNQADDPLVIEDASVEAFLEQDWNAAVEGWTAALEGADGPQAADELAQARLWFRLGCALRSRLDLGAPGTGASSGGAGARVEGDFQASVRAWTRALTLAPNNYIYRRRVEQYGPAMAKPYPFYDWVAQAREEIRERGEAPVPLIAEPAGAELAAPARAFPEGIALAEPDPDDRLDLDEGLLVFAEAAVVPCPALPGQSARVAVQLRPSATRDVHWTHDAGPVQLVVRPPEGFTASQRVISATMRDDVATSTETLLLDFELQIPASAAGQEFTLSLYCVYPVCEGEEGQCLFRRQNLSLVLPVGVLPVGAPPTGEKARRGRR